MAGLGPQEVSDLRLIEKGRKQPVGECRAPILSSAMPPASFEFTERQKLQEILT